MSSPNQIPPRIPPANGPVRPVGQLLGPDRWNRGAWLFRDRTLHSLEILLDEAFRIPGTGIRFGIDGIMGLVPGLGDVLAGILSLIIPLAAWIRGVPYVTLVRMAVNLGIGVLVGSIPLFGDIFDIAWKANRRNYQLLVRHIGEPHRHTSKDWAFLFLLAAALGLIFAIPIILLFAIILWVGNSLSSAAGFHS
ncbi:MAG: DUF4112 domain-containing protein [Terracidiphilus sp.]|jgi:hypothetical protein